MKYNYDEDGVAFYFFILTVLGVFIAVAGYYWVVVPLAAKRAAPTRAKEAVKCTCKGCQLKEHLKRTAPAAVSPASASCAADRAKKISLLVATVLFALAMKAVWNAQISYTPYDPFSILSVSESATDKQIKKAFNRLSLKWHPDKNEDKEAASVRFQEIQKAYKALTDPVARKNWEEHGNPDGPKGFSLGIALPAWLISSTSSRVGVLLAYGLVFGLLLPYLVASRWSKSRSHTRDSIRHTTMELFFRELNEQCQLKRLVEILAQASEFEELPWKTPTDAASVERLVKALPADYERLRKGATATASKVHAILYAHFRRIDLKDAASEELAVDRAAVVTATIRLILGMIQIVLAREWYPCARVCMTLSQFLVQAVWVDSASPLLQLPFLEAAHLKHFTSGKKSVKTVVELLQMKEDDRRALLRFLDDGQYAMLLRVAEAIPVVTVEGVDFKGSTGGDAFAFASVVLGQEEIHPGNIVTCHVRLRQTSCGEAALGRPAAAADRRDEESEEIAADSFEFDEDGNMIENDPATKSRLKALDPLVNPNPPVHAPFFPADKRPSWWLTICTPNNSAFVTPPMRIHDLLTTKVCTFQFAAPNNAGIVPLGMQLRSDSIIGADFDIQCAFKVTGLKEPVKEEQWELTDDSDNAIDNPFADEESSHDEE